MKIEKINENKIRIHFNVTELNENNISVHSFLSGTNDAKRLIYAILDIANEEFKFNIADSKLDIETFSINNKNFIIVITKLPQNIYSNSYSNAPYNVLELTKKQEDKNTLIYKFNTIDEVLNFCKYINSFIYNNFLTLQKISEKLISSLFKYNDSLFILTLDFELIENDIKNKMISILSEYQNHFYLSYLSLSKLKEHSNLIIEGKAIQAL